MARQVIWSEPAWEDLEATAAHITRDSKFYAATLFEVAHEEAAFLADSRECGQTVAEISDESIQEELVTLNVGNAAGWRHLLSDGPIRELLEKSWRLVYKVTDEYVFIVAFIPERGGAADTPTSAG
jgi:plasmid stabilization system protein ParE